MTQRTEVQIASETRYVREESRLFSSTRYLVNPSVGANQRILSENTHIIMIIIEDARLATTYWICADSPQTGSGSKKAQAKKHKAIGRTMKAPIKATLDTAARKRWNRVLQPVNQFRIIGRGGDWTMMARRDIYNPVDR